MHALCPQQAIDRKTPIAWHPVVKDLDAQEAQAAVIALKHSQKFIDPSDIVQQCTRSASSHPSSRSLDEALEFANRRELDPAGGTPATEEFLAAKKLMIERMEARDQAAFTAGPEAQAAAAAWIDDAIRGPQPIEEPLGVQPGDAPMSRWAILPSDPPKLRSWLRRKQMQEAG